MKKKVLKQFICGIILGFAFAFGFGLVNAELGSDSVIVKVGSVDAPVYSYEIDMSTLGFFDWKYNDENKTFEWKNSCLGIDASTNKTVSGNVKLDDDAIAAANKFYGPTCKVLYSFEPTSGVYYIEMDNSLSITDTSTLGKIKASIEYTPSEDYKWTGMNILTTYYSCEEASILADRPYNILNYYNDNTCSNLYNENSTFVLGTDRVYTYKLRSVGNQNPVNGYDEYPSLYTKSLRFDEPKLYYFAYSNGITVGYNELYNRIAEASFEPFVVQLNDNDKESFSTPLAGDVIGTITIKIQEDI